jgi:hypothetical protein
MSTTRELRRDCAYCRQQITLKWENGPICTEGVHVVLDQAFHDKCWDKFFAAHSGKRALPPGAGARTSSASSARVSPSSGSL